MEKQNNIVDELNHQMQTDDQCTDKISERLNKLYFKKASEAERELIDDLFITLCGWSFKTLHIRTTDIDKRQPTDSQKRAAGITSKIKEAFIKMAVEDEFPLDLSDGDLYYKIEAIIEAYDKPTET